MTETEFQKIIDDYRDENQRLKEMIDIKEQKIEQYKKIITTYEHQIFVQCEHIKTLKYLLNMRDKKNEIIKLVYGIIQKENGT